MILLIFFLDCRTDRNEKSSGDEDDECEPVPSFQSAFTDALIFPDFNLNVEDISQGKTKLRFCP